MKIKFKNIPADNCPLKEIEAFKHIVSDDLIEIEESRTCSMQEKGMILYREGNRINGFYAVHKGIIKLFKTGINGKEQILRFAKKGDIFGYRSIISNEVACTTAKIISDAVLTFVPASVLIDLVKQNSTFSYSVLRFACSELDVANKGIMNIAQKTVKERLAEMLILLKKDFEVDHDEHLQISLTREELASMVGTATESIIRLLAEFRLQRLIDVDGRKIRILDEAKLTKISKLYD